MSSKLVLRYDRVGDILYIDKCAPYKEQDAEELEDEIGVRLNPDLRGNRERGDELLLQARGRWRIIIGTRRSHPLAQRIAKIVRAKLGL